MRRKKNKTYKKKMDNTQHRIRVHLEIFATDRQHMLQFLTGQYYYNTFLTYIRKQRHIQVLFKIYYYLLTLNIYSVIFSVSCHSSSSIPCDLFMKIID